MSSSAIKVRCACVWVLEALNRWRSCSEVTSRASRPYGEMKGSSVLTAAHHVLALTWQSSLTSLDLWQPVYLPILSILLLLCLLTTSHRESASCFVLSLFLLPGWREASIRDVVIRPWLSTWEFGNCFCVLRVLMLSSSSFGEKGKIERSVACCP